MEDLFKKLNDFVLSEQDVEVVKNKDCCFNPCVVFDTFSCVYVCKNCGIVGHEDYVENNYENIKKESIYVNEIFVSNIVGPGSSELKRVQLFNNSGIRYKKHTLYMSYKDIDELFRCLNITNAIVIEQAKLYYKNIYLYEDDIKTRGKIKYGLYYYCILISIINNEYPYVITDIFKELDFITIGHYNKAIEKLNPDFYELLFIHPQMNEMIKIASELKIKIDLIDLIKLYNFYISKNVNINTGSILKGSVYKLIIDKEGYKNAFDKLFSKRFSTTVNTLRKFNNIIKTIV